MLLEPTPVVSPMPILLIGVIDRMFLNIRPMQNPLKKLLEQVKDQI
jgi:hypothetical protein